MKNEKSFRHTAQFYKKIGEKFMNFFRDAPAVKIIFEFTKK